MAEDRDQVVHVTLELPDGSRTEVVRADRAGKYYQRGADGSLKQLTLAQAVSFALLPGAQWHRSRVGGMRFDAEVRKALREKGR